MDVLCFRIGFVFDCGVVIFTLMGVNSVGIVFFVFRFYGFLCACGLFGLY